MVKDLPDNAGGLGAQVGFLEEEMAKHSATLAWIITWAEEPGRNSLWGCKESDMIERLSSTCICGNRIPTNTVALSSAESSCGSEVPKFSITLPRQNQVLADLCSRLEAQRKSAFTCLLKFLEAACFCWLMAPFPHP